MNDTTLIPVFDWNVEVANWFDSDDKTELKLTDKTFKEVQLEVDVLREDNPKSTVYATAIRSDDEMPSFITCPPLGMERDEANDMPYEEWNEKWYGHEFMNG